MNDQDHSEEERTPNSAVERLSEHTDGSDRLVDNTSEEYSEWYPRPHESWEDDMEVRSQTTMVRMMSKGNPPVDIPIITIQEGDDTDTQISSTYAVLLEEVR